MRPRSERATGSLRHDRHRDFTTALSNLGTHKMRTALTMLCATALSRPWAPRSPGM